MFELLNTVSDCVIGFFLFLLRSSEIAAWAQAAAIAATGLCALVAAGRAYAAAMAQIHSNERQAQETKRDEKNAVAALFLSETLMATKRMVGQIKILEKPDYIEKGYSRFQEHNFTVFEKEPNLIGKLPPIAAMNFLEFYSTWKSHHRFSLDNERTRIGQTVPTDERAETIELLKDVARNGVSVAKQLERICGAGVRVKSQISRFEEFLKN